MSWSCLSGWRPISRANLDQMVRDAIANEPKERQHLRDAISEYNDRANGVTDVKERFRIMKEVAKKYHYNEDYFMDRVNI